MGVRSVQDLRVAERGADVALVRTRFDEVLLGVKALGITATAAEVRPIFDEADKDKSGAIEMHEFAGICEGVANMRQGRAEVSLK